MAKRIAKGYRLVWFFYDPAPGKFYRWTFFLFFIAGLSFVQIVQTTATMIADIKYQLSISNNIFQSNRGTRLTHTTKPDEISPFVGLKSNSIAKSPIDRLLKPVHR